MKISVIIPVYNAEEFLEECLDSVVSQTIDMKEIICIDDGSTDNSYRVLSQYRKKYPYIKVFRQENKGAGEARNTGLGKAAGKYVCFLDADDFYLDPEALEKMVCACEQNHLQACAGMFKMYRAGTEEVFRMHKSGLGQGEDSGSRIVEFRERQDDYGYTAYIFSRDVIRENRIYFPPYRRYQDPPFFLKAMMAINKYMVLPIEFYGYRYSQEAASRKGLYMADTLRGIRDNMKIAEENHLEELKKLLIHRIDSEYAAWIISSADREILGLLGEIQRIAFGRNGRQGEQTEQEISLEIVKSLTAGSIKGNSLGTYFEKKGITEVAVYGLGTFGKIAVTELRKTGALTVYGIDRNMVDIEGISTGTLEEVNKKCNDIIITPIKGNEDMIRDIRKVWDGNVIGLYELVCEAAEL